MIIKNLLVLALLFLRVAPTVIAQRDSSLRIAPAPLFRDPVNDGAADSVVVWNQSDKSWWMLYTTRRANMPMYDVSGNKNKRLNDMRLRLQVEYRFITRKTGNNLETHL